MPGWLDYDNGRCEHREVLHPEHQYSTTLLHGDIKLLAPVLADSFVDTSERGTLRDKQQLLRIIAHQARPASIEETGRKIQIYGNAAVVTVKFEVIGNEQGKPYKSAGRVTDGCVKRNGQWYCVAAHSSAMESTTGQHDAHG